MATTRRLGSIDCSSHMRLNLVSRSAAGAVDLKEALGGVSVYEIIQVHNFRTRRLLDKCLQGMAGTIAPVTEAELPLGGSFPLGSAYDKHLSPFAMVAGVDSRAIGSNSQRYSLLLRDGIKIEVGGPSLHAIEPRHRRIIAKLVSAAPPLQPDFLPLIDANRDGLNAFMYDFYRVGSLKALVEVNGLYVSLGSLHMRAAQRKHGMPPVERRVLSRRPQSALGRPQMHEMPRASLEPARCTHC